MSTALAMFGTILVTFTTTNVDDFAMLLFFFACSRDNRSIRSIALGQILAFTLVLGASWAGAVGALIISPRLIALLALGPVVIGLIGLFNGNGDTPGEHQRKKRIAAQPPRVAQVLLLTLSLSTENLAVYTAYFASLGPRKATYAGAAYMVLLILMFWPAWKLANQRRVRTLLTSYAVPAAPYLYIGIGLFLIGAQLLSAR